MGGIIASFNYSLLFWIDGATNLLAAVLLLIFLRPGKRITANEKPEDSGSGGSAYKDKAYLSFIVLSTVFAMAFFQLFTTVPKYFRDNLHLSEQYIGYIMAFNGLIIVVFEMVLVYLLERRDRLLLYISAGVVLCGLGYLSLILPLPAKWGTTLMIVLMTAGEIIAMPFMSAYWTRRASVNNRGQYAALYTISWGAGQTLGPFLCAMLADAYGFTLMFLLVGLALFAAAFGYSRLGGGKITVSAEKTGQ